MKGMQGQKGSCQHRALHVLQLLGEQRPRNMLECLGLGCVAEDVWVCLHAFVSAFFSVYFMQCANLTECLALSQTVTRMGKPRCLKTSYRLYSY